MGIENEERDGPPMFLYEMHCHTLPCSACGGIQPEELVRGMKAAGYAGMVLTDHFYHGNTGIRRNLPWADFVAAYEESYLRAKAVGDQIDFDVLFGLEEGIGGGKEVLLYGITPRFVYDHPEMRDCDLAHLSHIVRQAGGLIYQAHPFRVRDYIAKPWEPLPAEYFDGAEIYNACNPPLDNLRAVNWAKETGLPAIAGSDRHYMGHCENFGIAVPHRLRTGAELVQVLRNEEYELHIPGV